MRLIAPAIRTNRNARNARWRDNLIGMLGRVTLNAAICAVMGTVLCGVLSPGAQAQAVTDTAELAHGEHVARFVCATCHVVAKNQEFAPMLSTPTPSFLEIANRRPGVSRESLQHFITSTHWDPDKLEMTMPALMLTPEDTRAVASYILSLRKH
jgi:mono/diheme cytochrome c family protein